MVKGLRVRLLARGKKLDAARRAMSFEYVFNLPPRPRPPAVHTYVHSSRKHGDGRSALVVLTLLLLR